MSCKGSESPDQPSYGTPVTPPYFPAFCGQAVKRKLTRLRVKVIFTSDSGQRVAKTKNIKLKLNR
jgi:hypothetical protein